MAGTSYFGNRSGATGDSPFFKLKAIPLINRTNVPRLTDSELNSTNFVDNSYIPVWRSGAANNYFTFDNNLSEIKLYSVNTSGNLILLSTVTFTTYLTNSHACSAYVSSSDQCIYILLYESPQYRLIKVSDSSGTATAIGSAFTPTTAANWPVTNFSLLVDNGTGLKLYCRGYEHVINKTTGAIISQNTVVTVGGYSLVNTCYLSSDNTVACAPFRSLGTSQPEYATLFQELVATSSGNIRGLRILDTDIFQTGHPSTIAAPTCIIAVDSDKLFLGNVEVGTTTSLGYIYRSDFDEMLRSIVDWYSGV